MTTIQPHRRLSLLATALRRTAPGSRIPAVITTVDRATTGVVIAAGQPWPQQTREELAGDDNGPRLTVVEPDLADIVMIRPRKFVCPCGKPATRMHASRVGNAEPIRTCAECPAPGLRVISGSDGAA